MHETVYNRLHVAVFFYVYLTAVELSFLVLSFFNLHGGLFPALIRIPHKKTVIETICFMHPSPFFKKLFFFIHQIHYNYLWHYYLYQYLQNNRSLMKSHSYLKRDNNRYLIYRTQIDFFSFFFFFFLPSPAYISAATNTNNKKNSFFIVFFPLYKQSM